MNDTYPDKMIVEQPNNMKRTPLNVAIILASTALLSAIFIFLTIAMAQYGSHYIHHLPEAHRLDGFRKFLRLNTGHRSRKISSFRKSPSSSPKSISSYDPEAELKPIGLRNTDKRCFLNSIIQLLYHDRTFRRVLARESSSNERLEALRNFFAKMDASAPKTEISAPIQSLLPAYLANRHEQDAAEALQIFLNDIEDAELTLQTRITVTNVLLDGSTEISSTNDEPRCLIQLNIPLEQATSNSLQSLFELQFAEESIEASGSEAERVRMKVKTTSFTELPKTLLIQLVRQHFLTDGLKISDRIEVPEFIQIPGHDVQYQLSGFIYHQGLSMDSGHYSAFLRQADSSFTLFNDQMIKANADISEVKDYSYIYSYVRIN